MLAGAGQLCANGSNKPSLRHVVLRIAVTLQKRPCAFEVLCGALCTSATAASSSLEQDAAQASVDINAMLCVFL